MNALLMFVAALGVLAWAFSFYDMNTTQGTIIGLALTFAAITLAINVIPEADEDVEQFKKKRTR